LNEILYGKYERRLKLILAAIFVMILSNQVTFVCDLFGGSLSFSSLLSEESPQGAGPRIEHGTCLSEGRRPTHYSMSYATPDQRDTLNGT
jgi:hypothetical protein